MRILLTVLLFVVPALASAQEGVRSLKQMSLEALGNIEVVTASKMPETLWRTPAALTVITQEDIRRSGATTLAEALRLAPGVNVAQMDADHWTVGVRGFSDQFSKALSVLIDGRSVYTPLLGGVNWSVQDALLSDIDRIEVIRGPGGVIWGPNAQNGVINIITKRASATRGTLITAGTGNVDHAVGGIRIGGGNPEGTSYRLYGKSRTHGPQFHTDGRDFDRGNFTQAGFRVDWGTRVTLQGDLYKGSVGQAVSLATFNPPAQYLSTGALDVDGGNLMLQWTGKTMRFQTYYDRTYQLGPQVGELRHTFDVDFIHSIPEHYRHKLTWGLNAHVSPSHVTQTIPTLSIDPHNRINHVYSAFVQDEFALVKNKLAVTVGSKVLETDYVGFDAQPSARLLWTPRPTQSIWTSITRAIRTPSRLERDFDLSGYLGELNVGGQLLPTFIRVAGTDDFRSERLLGEEIGYRTVLFGQVFLDVAAFHNQYDDLEALGAPVLTLIQNVTPRLRFLIPYVNGVKATSNGLELAPEWNPTAWWRLRGSYSYMRINATNYPGVSDRNTAGDYEGSSPNQQARLSSFISTTRWELDGTLRYVGAMPARQAPAYTAVDAHVSWKVRPDLRLTLSVLNLDDAQHAEIVHDPPPTISVRRSAFVGFSWTR